MSSMKSFRDYEGGEIRLTSERLKHILKRPEMKDQLNKIEETLKEPEEIRRSKDDPSVHLYYRKYRDTPVTEKYLLVVVKADVDNPFVITSFFTDKVKSGEPVQT